ncbi:MAG: Ig-like domain-containing protein [Gemmatimonadales bacterium]
MRRPRTRTVQLCLAGGLVALAACSSGGTGPNPPPAPPPPPPPAPVASVTVTPNQATIEVGQTTTLSAQPKDANGNPLSRAVTWSSSNNQIASVNAGLVTAVAPGNATISATSEGKTGEAAITVLAPSPIVIGSIAPDPMIEGQPATITGSGFDALPANNIVRIAGLDATVTQASTTQLQITVPAGLCRPKDAQVPVQITVRIQTSNPRQHRVRPAAFVNLAVGQLQVFQSPGDRCVQFDALGAPERYVIGAQSVLDVATTLTAVKVEGDIPAGAPSALPLPQVQLAAAPGGPPSSAELQTLRRWAEHRAREAEGYERDRPALQRIADGIGPALTGPALAPSVPGTVQVGDVLAIKFQIFGSGNSCTNFVVINARVRGIYPRAIILVDEANPSPVDQAIIDQAGADFTGIYDQDIAQFGAVGDLDANQRLVIVITREVNRVTNPPLAFVSHANILPPDQCQSSNEGEYFFMRAPDPTGQFPAGVYPEATLQQDFPMLLIHEFAHNIQGARRRAVNGPFMTSWLAEGLATSAQEIVGFQILALQDGQNYGPNVVYSTFGGDPRRFFSYQNDLLAYFGFNFVGGRVPTAPEECTWVGSTATGNPGSCSNLTRLLYGVPWSLIKNAIDRYHGGAAGQQQILQAFSNYAGPSGFPELETVLGRPIATLLAEWAPVLYLDDRYPAAGFQMANWNLQTIVAAWNTPNANLIPRMRGFQAFSDEFQVRAGSSAYYEMSGAARPATALRVRSPDGTPLPPHMQLWVVRVQ